MYLCGCICVCLYMLSRPTDGLTGARDACTSKHYSKLRSQTRIYAHIVVLVLMRLYLIKSILQLTAFPTSR